MRNDGLLPAIGVALMGLLAIVVGVAQYAQIENGQADRAAVADVSARLDAMADANVTDEGPGDQVIELPDDGGAWHVSLIVTADWRTRPSQRAVVSWFYTHPTLCSLRTQAHWHLYTSGHPIYLERLRPVLGSQVPAILVTNQHGKVVYRGAVQIAADAKPAAADYETLPAHPDQLAGRLRFLFQRFRDRDGNCPGPGPCPSPDETPDEVEPSPDEFPAPINDTPDLGQEAAEKKTQWILPVWVPIVCGIAGLVIALVLGVLRRIQTESQN